MLEIPALGSVISGLKDKIPSRTTAENPILPKHHEPRDPADILRLRADLKSARHLAYIENMMLVDPTIAVLPENIIKEPGEFENLQVTDPKVTEEAKKRQSMQQARKLLQQTPVEQLASLADQDGPLNGKSEDQLRQMKALVETFDLMYERDSIKSAGIAAGDKTVQTEIDNLVDQKIKLAIEEKNKKRDQSTPEITALTQEEIEQIKKETQLTQDRETELRNNATQQYFNEETGEYYRIDTKTGQPDRNSVIIIDETTYIPIYNEVIRISQPENGQTSASSEQAGNLLETLKYDPGKNEFVTKTVDQADTERRKQLENEVTEAQECLTQEFLAMIEDHNIPLSQRVRIMESLTEFTRNMDPKNGLTAHFVRFTMGRIRQQVEESRTAVNKNERLGVIDGHIKKLDSAFAGQDSTAVVENLGESLGMGLDDEYWNKVRSDVNKAVENNEDPVDVINKAMDEFIRTATNDPKRYSHLEQTMDSLIPKDKRERMFKPSEILKEIKQNQDLYTTYKKQYDGWEGKPSNKSFDKWLEERSAEALLFNQDKNPNLMSKALVGLYGLMLISQLLQGTDAQSIAGGGQQGPSME